MSGNWVLPKTSNFWSTPVSITLSTTGVTVLGVTVPSNNTYVLTEITLTNLGSGATYVTIYSGDNIVLDSIEVAAESTVVWYGTRVMNSTEVLKAKTSSVTGGSTLISASGIKS